MNKEKIERKARQLYIIDYMMPIQLGVAMAEWMQEQKQAEIAELTNLVSARDGMIEQMAERMEELDDKVSELTEELDASHIFCEGVKDAVVEKACKWLENEYFNGKLRKIDGSWFVFESEFVQAMKGGSDD